MRNTLIFILMSILLFPILALGGGGFPDPIEYENFLANNTTAIHSAASLLNQATQIKNQIQLIENEVTNTGSLSNYQWQNITQLVQELDAVTRQGQSLSYATTNLDAEFRQKYPDYSDQHPEKYSAAYMRWNASTLDTLRTSLKAVGLSANDFTNEQSTLKQLELQGKTARGRMQALQVSTEIAAQNVTQLQELKRIVAAQTNAQNSYMAYRVSKDSYNEKSLAEINDAMPTAFPHYKNNSAFGKIPTE